jgi:hypothetical protein
VSSLKYSPLFADGFVPVMIPSVIMVLKTLGCGDVDASGGVDIDDVVYLLNYIFLAGPPPYSFTDSDVDCSGDISIDDVVYLIAYIFFGGYDPCDPDGNGVADC